jgi:DNA-binding transcriptional MocR family regulator
MNVVDMQVERVYRYIWDYLVEREELPTVRQVAKALSMSQE